MRKGIGLIMLGLMLCSLALCSCSPEMAGKAGGLAPSDTLAAAKTPAMTAAPVSTPMPTESPTPVPPPTQEPTPTPTPSPTPDPWAGIFHPGGAYVSVKDFTKGPWIYKDETLSVKIKYTRAGTCNRTCYIAEVYARGPLFRRGFAFQSDKGKTELPYKIARRYDAVLGITADYFNHRSNRKGVMLQDGKVYHDKQKNSTLAILPDGELKVISPGKTNAESLIGLGVKDSFAFGPILVSDGKINQKSIKDHWLSSKATEYRAAVGMIEKGHYIVIVTKGSFTMQQLAQVFVDYKCTVAYNMDGGHSACMIFMGEQLNHPFPSEINGQRQRPLPDLMMIGTHPAVPDVKDKVYCDGVNVRSKNRPKPTDGLLKP